jgi:hypothetical protein
MGIQPIPCQGMHVERNPIGWHIGQRMAISVKGKHHHRNQNFMPSKSKAMES